MADEKKPVAYVEVPDPKEPTRSTARAVQDEESAYRRYIHGDPFISKAEADRLYKQEQVETPGVLQSAALGLSQGVTGGLGIPAMARLAPADTPEGEEYRRTRIEKAQDTTAYKVASALGLIAPTLLTGGGAAAGRAGAAGLVPAVGSLAERAAASVLPRAPGLLGEALSLGARGAAEGAVMSLGDAATQAYVHGNPFTAQAALSSLSDGALMGGIVGGALGAGTASMGHVASGLGNVLTRETEEGANKVFARMGLTSKQAEAATARAGSAAKALEELRPLLEEGNYSAKQVNKIAKRLAEEHQEVRMDIARQLDKEAVTSTSGITARALDRLETDVIAPLVGTVSEQAARQTIVDAVAQKILYAETHASGTPWANIVKTRDAIQSELRPYLEGAKVGGPEQNWAIKALNAFDASVHEAMAQVSPETAKRFGAATLSRDLSTIFEEGTANKVARAMMEDSKGIVAGLQNRDLLVAGAVGSYSPLGAAAGLAAKGLAKLAGEAMEPAVTRWMARSAMGASAEKAAVDLKTHIGASLKAFFEQSPRLAVAATRERKKKSYSAEDAEAAVDKVRYLVSPRHQADVAQYLNRMRQAGQPELADSISKVNQAAVKQVMHNLPESNQGRAMRNMTKPVKLKAPTMESLKFLNRMKGVVGGPLSLLESMQDGSLSPEQVEGHKAVWGDVHDYIVSEAQSRIVDAQASGKPISMDKVAMLSLVTGVPMNSFMTPEYIQEIQSSFVVEEKAQPPQPATPNPIATSMQTPLEKTLA